MWTKRAVFAVLFLVVGLISAACGTADVGVNVRRGGIIEVDVTIDEAAVNQQISEALASNPNAFLTAGSVDFAPGQITLTGSFNNGERPGTLQGSITFGLIDESGAIRLTIENVNISGYDANDEEILQISLWLNRLIQNATSAALATDIEATAEAEATFDPLATEIVSPDSTTAAVVEQVATAAATDSGSSFLTVTSAQITDTAIEIVVQIDLR